MTNTEIMQFKIFVCNTLIKKYHVDETEATSAVQNSYLTRALEIDKDFVEHDTVEEWAEFVYNEIKNEQLVMMQYDFR